MLKTSHSNTYEFASATFEMTICINSAGDNSLHINQVSVPMLSTSEVGELAKLFADVEWELSEQQKRHEDSGSRRPFGTKSKIEMEDP